MLKIQISLEECQVLLSALSELNGLSLNSKNNRHCVATEVVKQNKETFVFWTVLFFNSARFQEIDITLKPITLRFFGQLCVCFKQFSLRWYDQSQFQCQPNAWPNILK